MDWPLSPAGLATRRAAVEADGFFIVRGVLAEAEAAVASLAMGGRVIKCPPPSAHAQRYIRS
jgi:hypothetical protein